MPSLFRIIIFPLLLPFFPVILFIRSAATNIFGFLSVIGLAITVLGSIEPLVVLAHWARYIILNWRYWTFDILRDLFSLFHIDLPRSVASIITHTFFIFALGVSSSERFIEFFNRVKKAVVGSRIPEITLDNIDDRDEIEFQHLLIVSTSYVLICYSATAGTIMALYDVKSWGSLWQGFVDFGYDPIWLVLSLACSVLAIYAMNAWANENYLRSRLEGFLGCVTLFLILNYISVNGDQILGWLSSINKINPNK